MSAGSFYLRGAPAKRFWMKVGNLGGEGCWPWLAAVNADNGYGAFYIDGRQVKAHRWAYESTIGSVPDGLVLDHLCRTRHCVNPRHLEPVTQSENQRRGRPSTPQGTHCRRGHLRTEENTYVSKTGGRTCRDCLRLLRGARSK